MTAPPGSMTERRRAMRHGVRGPVAFRVQNWYPRRGSVLDLCMDGCLIEPQLASGCVPGDVLEIRFEVKGVAFRAQCVVRRVSAEGLLGIELTRISDRSREELRLLLRDVAGDGLDSKNDAASLSSEETRRLPARVPGQP